MEYGTIFYLAIIVLSGLIFGKFAKYARLPNVTGYLVAGLLIGPILRIVPHNIVSELKIVSEMALGFVAFSIGSEFKLSYLKRVGKSPIIIALFEAVFAVVFVFAALMVLGNDFSFSLVLASIAAATAPAATIMVIRQYKAKGPVTDTLMSVVALDDAVAIILFGFNITIANSILNPVEGQTLLLSILYPIIEIVVSLGIGVVMGILLTLLCRWFSGPGTRINATFGIAMLTIGIVQIINLNTNFNTSTLLAAMMLGAVFVNISQHYIDVMNLTERITPPIFTMFFVISGAEIDLSVVVTVGLIGIIYILFRVFGKVFGSYLGAKLSKAEPLVQKYLGWSLVPQAGVAIGLSLIAQDLFANPTTGQAIRTVILFATFIYELVGPLITKMSLQKAGEIAKHI
ncbi:MAG TPA: cation:proton antiporter [Bacilli bacterium]|nr:cation:proton antiporter [Bacilli bacterium]